MGADQLGQRHYPPGNMPDPVGQGGVLDLDALARQDRRLAVERQAIEVLADHHAGDETRIRAALWIGRSGAGACKIRSHDRQLSFGRIWRIALRRAGIFSSTSLTSSPSLEKCVPPQPRADRTRMMHDL